MILCVIIFLGIHLFDGISFLQRVYAVLKPTKWQSKGNSPIADDNNLEVTSPILEPITQAEVEAHDREKVEAEEKHEQEVIESEIFEEKILEEIKEQEQIEEMGESMEKVEESKNTEEEIENAEEVKEIPEIKEMKEDSKEIEETMVWENTKEEVKKIEEAHETDEVQKVEEIQEKREEIGEIIIWKNIKEEAEEIKEATHTTEDQTSSKESHTIPITASIPEAIPEVKKSTESQYTERLYTITNEVKTLIARGHPQDARALIIQGLALDKNHRELNLILGSIYESERQAQKAEYIYKDLALVYPDDGEILERLANILIIEKRYDLALEIYKKIVSLSGETEWSLYIMTHLAYELGHDEELYAYARRYQKNWPNNPDILTLLAHSEISLGERQAAIQTLIKLKNLTPYNNEIMETIAKLTMEEELAGNFASRDHNQKN